eukprot:3537847-Prymnesium_polylepis.1
MESETRKYKVFRAPNGQRFDSMVKARKHLESAGGATGSVEVRAVPKAAEPKLPFFPQPPGTKIPHRKGAADAMRQAAAAAA